MAERYVYRRCYCVCELPAMMISFCVQVHPVLTGQSCQNKTHRESPDLEECGIIKPIYALIEAYIPHLNIFSLMHLSRHHIPYFLKVEG